MEKTELLHELESIRQKIRYHNHRYYVENDPVVSDFEYDQLTARMREIEAEHPEWITPDSPSQRIGAPVSGGFNKVEHPAPILSLSNAFNLDDVRAWYERVNRLDDRVSNTDFVLEPKFDGLTVVLHYHNGVFVQGATRGDGRVGEDITANLRTIRSLPLRIPVDPDGPEVPAVLVVRGEVLMLVEDFEKLNAQMARNGDKTYLNPRNTAAGSLRQLDPQITASRPLMLLTYAIIDANGPVPETQWAQLEYLRALGFPMTEEAQYCAGLESMLKGCEAQMAKRDSLPFEVDGVVIKINDLALSRDLGIVGKDPRGAVALKYPAREVTTTLEDIQIKVGRTGVLTPNAVLAPVEIGGVIVKQATLHNFDYISDLDIRIGDRVMVKRAGDVIPKVVGPVKDTRTGDEKIFQPPAVCPACQEPVEHFEGEVAWYCVNAACPAQLIRNVEHFVSRTAMDIVGLGIKIVEQLIEAGLVKDVADLYALQRDALLALEGFKDKKADNLLAAIAASRQQSLARLINALGIRGVGEVAAVDLAARYPDLDQLSQAQPADLEAIENFGPNMAEAIVDWFRQPQNQALLAKLKQYDVWPVAQADAESLSGEQILTGMTFVITGTLPNYSRSEAKEMIEAQGGKVTSSVSKNTSYLLVGSEPGSKLEKGQKLGIEILDETARLKLIGK
jgi:DNA ligase (NAD+)